MGPTMQRGVVPMKGVTVGTSADTSQSIPFQNSSGGQVHVYAGSSLTALTWYASVDGVLFLPVQDGQGNAVASIVSAGISCLIPASCFSCAFLKAVGNAAGSIDLALKS